VKSSGDCWRMATLRGWELHDQDGLLAAGHSLHQLMPRRSPRHLIMTPAPAPKPAPLPAPASDTDGLLPPGDYTFEVVETDVRDNRAGTCQYLLIVLEGLGDAAGYGVRDYLNLSNPSEWAVRTGRERLRQICVAPPSRCAANDCG
jgi:hypothetical protein